MGIGELGNKYIHKSLTLADKWNSAIQWVQYDLYETKGLLIILSAFLLPHLCLLCDIASFCNNQKSKLGFVMEGMKRKSNSGLGLLHPSVWTVRGREGQAFWTPVRGLVGGLFLAEMELGLLRVGKGCSDLSHLWCPNHWAATMPSRRREPLKAASQMNLPASDCS